jgi:alkylation response protein AidB-like acyl-CoA dehydrogenase
MDIRLSEDQIEIARQARRFCENETPVAYVRKMFEDDQGYEEEKWLKMVEMGWTALSIPEEYGGLGLSTMDLAVILEEMGRAVQPGPYFSTVILAAETILAAGNNEQKAKYLSGIAEGRLKGTLALFEPDSGGDPEYLTMAAVPANGKYVLNGVKLFVPDAHVADFIIVAALTENQGLSLFVVDSQTPGLGITLLPTMDGTRKLCAVQFKDVAVPMDQILGIPGQAQPALTRVLQKAQVGLSAESVGGAQRALEMATDYAKVRVQFEQPIGSFQSVKHRCAQMYLEVESSRSMMYWAAWAQDHGREDEAALAAAAAKAYVSEAYCNVASGAVQILGGIGMTWEHDIHLYLKRAKANEMAWGDPCYQREKVLRISAGA